MHQRESWLGDIDPISFTVAGQRRACTDFPRYLWWLIPTRTDRRRNSITVSNA